MKDISQEQQNYSKDLEVFQLCIDNLDIQHKNKDFKHWNRLLISRDLIWKIYSDLRV